MLYLLPLSTPSGSENGNLLYNNLQALYYAVSLLALHNV